MHKAVIDFCKYVKKLHPHHFIFTNVVDFGSLDINGNNRYLFKYSRYVGVDIYPGKNVDVVLKAHQYYTNKKVGVAISTEMLEHDVDWMWSVGRMYNMIKQNGLMILTFATDGRIEHGTTKHAPEASPGTLDYYHNISFNEFKLVIEPYSFFSYEIKVNSNGDMMFWGIKK